MRWRPSRPTPDALGAEFKDIFVDHKRTEWDKAFFQVSAEQHEAMLTYI
jgi:glutamine synthetase